MRAHTESAGRGQTELLGFTILLLVGLTVTFGTLVGGASYVSDMNEDANSALIESDMESLQQDHGEIAEGSILRSSDIELNDAMLELDTDDKTTIDVTVSGPNIATYTEQVQTVPIRVSQGDFSRVVEHGGLMVDGTGSSMLSNPAFDIRQKRTVLPLVGVDSAAGGTTLSGGTATVTSYRSNIDVTTLDPVQSGSNADAQVELVIDSSRYRAYSNYFDSLDDVSVTTNPSQEEVVVQFTTKEIAVQVLEVDTQLER